MERGAKWGPNEGEPDNLYEKGHIDSDLENRRISRRRNDATPGEFQHRLIPSSYDACLAGESLSGGKESHILQLSIHLDNYQIHSSNLSNRI
jgi:hypothetical protein